MKFKDLTVDNIGSLSREELEDVVIKGKSSLEKRYFSAQESLDHAVGKINELEYQKTILEAEKRQWVEQKIMQEEIVKHQIGNSDNTVSQLQSEILNIKKTVKLAIVGARIDGEKGFLSEKDLMESIRELY